MTSMLVGEVINSFKGKFVTIATLYGQHGLTAKDEGRFKCFRFPHPQGSRIETCAILEVNPGILKIEASCTVKPGDSILIEYPFKNFLNNRTVPTEDKIKISIGADLEIAAEKALKFVGSINWGRLGSAEQKEAREVVNALVGALKPEAR